MPKYDAVSTDPQVPLAEKPAIRQDPPKLVPISVNIPEDLRKSFRVHCAMLGIKLQDGIAEALREWIANHPTDTGNPPTHSE